MTSCGIAQAFHFKKAHLVKTASENVDDVAVVGSSFREIIVELTEVSNRA